MNVTVSHDPVSQVQADVLIIPQYEGAPGPAGLGEVLSELISGATQAGDFAGEFGQTALFYTTGLKARKVLLAGLGKPDKVDYPRIRRFAGMTARAARQSGAKTVAFALPAVAGLEAGKVAQFVTEGAMHGLYRFTTFKSDNHQKPNVESLVFVGGPEIDAGVSAGTVLGEATNVTRAVNWLPGNHLTAAVFAEKAVLMAQAAGNIEIEVFDKHGCEQLGLGLLLAVNQGSVEEPRFIVMKYKGNGGNGPWLGLIGKGLTFDSGGISIKPSDSMWDMKYDMSGGGAVLGAMQAIAQFKPKCDVLAIIGATDNLPDGKAYKPGDVIVGLSGKTVEVRSTDAEGRLVLADCVAYAVNQGCAKLVTAATLTGAANIALGPIRMGLVTNNDDWESEVFTAVDEAGERGWRLPHDEEYYDLFKSPIADMSNTGTARAAGTVVGGLFLMKHVGKTPLVHLDIAAQAWKSAEDKYEDAGATGVAVKSFVRIAQRFAEENR
ncbi:MAG TPA: leucyl aminopeptidase [Symbiobacteriaceae bacterium]